MGAKYFFTAIGPVKGYSLKRCLASSKIALEVSRYGFSPLDERNDIRNCDIVFVIKGEGLSPSFIKKMRLLNPHAWFIHYQWDSLVNVKYAGSRWACLITWQVLIRQIAEDPVNRLSADIFLQ